MKKLFVLLIISMLGIWAVKISGADRPKVAILEFSTINIPQQFGVLTPDWLSVGLVKSNRFVVLERTNIEKILQEKKIERTALFDPSQIQKFASLIGATHVIYGSISDRTGQAFSAMDWFMSNAQQRIEINVKLADIKTGEIVYSDSVYADSRELIERAIARLTTKLLAQVPMNGVILEVSGKDVFIDLGASDGVAEGDMFEVVSQGRTVTHPVTGEVVTLPERRSAEVVVNEVYPRTLKGRLIVAKGAQELEIARGMAVRSNNVKQNSLSQNLRRVNDIYSSSVGMGYVGLASAQGSIFNINPAGLPQVQNSEISLSWKYVGSTFGITQQGVYKEHLNGYSPFKDNALFPNGLNFVAAFGDGLGLGVNLHTDGVATNPKSDLNFENGQFEYSISLGKAFNPHFMAGLAIGGVNQWHAYEPQGVASTNYSFRGNHWMTKFGVLFRPDKDLSLGGIVAVPLSKSSGPGKVGEASNDYQVDVASELGLGIMYTLFENTTLGLDMIAKTRPSVETFYETRMGVGYQINPEWSTNFGYYYTVNYIPKLISDPQYGKSYNLVRSYATAGVKYRKDRTFIEAAIEYGGLRDSVTIRPSSAGTPIATLDQFKDYSLSVRVGTQF